MFKEGISKQIKWNDNVVIFSSSGMTRLSLFFCPPLPFGYLFSCCCAVYFTLGSWKSATAQILCWNKWLQFHWLLYLLAKNFPLHFYPGMPPRLQETEPLLMLEPCTSSQFQDFILSSKLIISTLQSLQVWNPYYVFKCNSAERVQIFLPENLFLSPEPHREHAWIVL